MPTDARDGRPGIMPSGPVQLHHHRTNWCGRRVYDEVPEAGGERSSNERGLQLTASSAAALLRRLLHRPPQPRPDSGSIAQEVLPSDRIGGQKCPGRPGSLAAIAGVAGGDEVAIGAIAATHLRLDMIQGELLFREELRAVDTAEAVTAEDSLSRRQTVPISPWLCHGLLPLSGDAPGTPPSAAPRPVPPHEADRASPGSGRSRPR